MCAKSSFDPQASLLMKEIDESESHEQKEKDEIVQDADFAGDLSDSKSTSGGMLCTFGEHRVCQFHGRVRNRRQCHTEAEVVSLDTDLRIEGSLAVAFAGYFD